MPEPGPGRLHVRLSDALTRIFAVEERTLTLFEHGSLLAKIYAPRGADQQAPHMRDEIYVVASGSGVFFDGHDRRPFGPGDFLFAAAGSVHRFESFSADFATWVFFYGPPGGEKEK